MQSVSLEFILVAIILGLLYFLFRCKLDMRGDFTKVGYEMDWLEEDLVALKKSGSATNTSIYAIWNGAKEKYAQELQRFSKRIGMNMS